MMTYWISFIISGLILEWTPLKLVPGLWHLRVIVLALLLSPAYNLKKTIYDKLFDKEEHKFENYIE